jgi:hypothetical protein
MDLADNSPMLKTLGCVLFASLLLAQAADRKPDRAGNKAEEAFRGCAGSKTQGTHRVGYAQSRHSDILSSRDILATDLTDLAD